MMYLMYVGVLSDWEGRLGSCKMYFCLGPARCGGCRMARARFSHLFPLSCSALDSCSLEQNPSAPSSLDPGDDKAGVLRALPASFIIQVNSTPIIPINAAPWIAHHLQLIPPDRATRRWRPSSTCRTASAASSEKAATRTAPRGLRAHARALARRLPRPRPRPCGRRRRSRRRQRPSTRSCSTCGRAARTSRRRG